MEKKESSDIQSRWRTYGNYRLILFAWMMNETTFMFATVELSHNGCYVRAALQIMSTIFIGIPLIYSEICIAQYTNCNAVTMWNFFPILRGIGYCIVFLVIIKTIYIMVLTTWYLEYTFYAALDPPPWFSCDDYNDTRCMVKRIDISIFQHCLQTENVFQQECDKKTASNCFFENEIGGKNTLTSLECLYSWKTIVASTTISFALFILTIKREKFIQIIVKLLVIYVSLVVILLLFVSLSTSGVWLSTKVSLDWRIYNFDTCLRSITNGFVAGGTGYGVIGFLSRDVSFRSPANMTSISTSLFSVFTCVMLSIVIFCGIKTMSYYHGEEENVVEMEDFSYFQEFASISEILSYFDAMPVWGFAWFSTGFWCLFVNMWILYLFLREFLLENIYFSRKHVNLSCSLLSLFLLILSLPFFCSDLTGALTDAIEILQITNSLFFSISLYWIYGYNKHNMDIVFMIGIKASYFWKICWVLNPIILATILYSKCTMLHVNKFPTSHKFPSIQIDCDNLLLILLLSIYLIIFIVCTFLQIFEYHRKGNLFSLIVPCENWGPKDPILLRSRKMFVPEIMTREFLYRQVRIHGICNKKSTKSECKIEVKGLTSESPNKIMDWSALTSN